MNPTSRRPSFRVLINGDIYPASTSATVTSTNYANPDCMHVTLHTTDKYTSKYWTSVTELALEIQYRADAAHVWTTLITGEAYKVTLDPIGGLVTLRGYDNSMRLAVSPADVSFQSRTAQEVADILSRKHGLIPILAGPMVRNSDAGIGHDVLFGMPRFSSALTDWALLVSLARHSGYDVFVRGSELYFVDPSFYTYPVKNLTASDVSTIRIRRDPRLSRDVTTNVQSWSLDGSMQYASATAVSQSTTLPMKGGATSLNLQIPNSNNDDCRRVAKEWLRELIQHETSIELSMPAEAEIMPRCTIVLSGPGVEFGGQYTVANVERSLSPRKGFLQRVLALHKSQRAIS